MKTFSYHLKYKYCWALVKPNSSFSCKNSFYWLIRKPLRKGGSQKDKIKTWSKEGKMLGDSPHFAKGTQDACCAR